MDGALLADDAEVVHHGPVGQHRLRPHPRAARRQVWVVLTEQLARQRCAKPTAWLGALPLALLLDWLADHLETLYREERSIPLAGIPCAP